MIHAQETAIDRYYVRIVMGATRNSYQVWQRSIGGSVFVADCRLSEGAAEKIVDHLNGQAGEAGRRAAFAEVKQALGAMGERQA